MGYFTSSFLVSLISAGEPRSSDLSHFKCPVTTCGYRLKSMDLAAPPLSGIRACSFLSPNLPIFNCKRHLGRKVPNDWMSSVVSSWWPSLDPSAFSCWKQGSGYWLLQILTSFNSCIWLTNPGFKSCIFSTLTGAALR